MIDHVETWLIIIMYVLLFFFKGRFANHKYQKMLINSYFNKSVDSSSSINLELIDQIGICYLCYQKIKKENHSC